MSDRQIHVGVIIAGQMRQFEEAFAKLKQNLNFKHHVFVSTWSNRGGKIMGAWGVDQIHRVLDDPAAKSLYFLLPPFVAQTTNEFFDVLPEYKHYMNEVTEKKDTITTAMLRAWFPDAEIDVTDLNAYNETVSETKGAEHNSSYYLNRIHGGIVLAERFEAQRGEKFSHFIIMRPDLLLGTDLRQAITGDEPIFRTPWIRDGGDATDDMILIGGRGLIEGVKQLWSRIEANGRTTPPAWRGIHVELPAALKAQGLSPTIVSNVRLASESIPNELFLELVRKSHGQVAEAARPTVRLIELTLLLFLAKTVDDDARAWIEEGLNLCRSHRPSVGFLFIASKRLLEAGRVEDAYSAILDALPLCAGAYHSVFVDMQAGLVGDMLPSARVVDLIGAHGVYSDHLRDHIAYLFRPDHGKTDAAAVLSGWTCFTPEQKDAIAQRLQPA